MYIHTHVGTGTSGPFGRAAPESGWLFWIQQTPPIDLGMVGIRV